MSKIIKKIFDVLFIIIILVLVSYFILRMNKIIEVYNVKTGSMEDNIHAGDYVLIIRKNNYEIGDVITFKKDGYLITHRIIKKYNDLFVTKGDANSDEDGPIKYNQIVGKVIIIGGYLNIIIKYKYLLASIFISLYLLSCYFIGDKENNNESKEKNDNKENIDESNSNVIETLENISQTPTIVNGIEENKIIANPIEEKDVPKKENIEKSNSNVIETLKKTSQIPITTNSVEKTKNISKEKSIKDSNSLEIVSIKKIDSNSSKETKNIPKKKPKNSQKTTKPKVNTNQKTNNSNKKNTQNKEVISEKKKKTNQNGNSQKKKKSGQGRKSNNKSKK